MLDLLIGLLHFPADLALLAYGLGQALGPLPDQTLQYLFLPLDNIDSCTVKKEYSDKERGKGKRTEPPCLPERRLDGNPQRKDTIAPLSFVVKPLDHKCVPTGIEIGISRRPPLADIIPRFVKTFELVGVLFLVLEGIVQRRKFEADDALVITQREIAG